MNVFVSILQQTPVQLTRVRKSQAIKPLIDPGFISWLVVVDKSVSQGAHYGGLLFVLKVQAEVVILLVRIKSHPLLPKDFS